MPARTLYVWQASPGPAAPYTDWTTAAHTIQDAIDAAIDGDTVLVTNGVYASGGRALYGTMTNRVAVNKSLTVLSLNGPAVTVISGAPASGGGTGDGAIRCAYVGQSAVLSGFTLTNGHTRWTNGLPIEELSGGGAWCENEFAMVTNCTLTGNSAGFAGGGTYSGTLNNCTLTGNGALYGGGSDSATLHNCTLNGNSATILGGGADNGTLNNCTLDGNSAPQGGGAYSVTLYFCTLSGNSAFQGGGALGCTLNNCVLAGNSAVEGGGTGTSKLNNCTLTGNSATYGGGSYNDALYNCTLTHNSATNSGGGMYYGSLQNGIVFYNSAPSGSNYLGSYFAYSCTTLLPPGAGNITNEPSFVDLTGGDLHLESNSPCIDAGNNAEAPGLTDVEGRPRIANGLVDMGAYEFQDTGLAGLPFFETQPLSATKVAGSTASFSVLVGGPEPIAYQWRKDGVALPDGGNIAGTMTPDLTISQALKPNEGGYSVVLTNIYGAVTSVVARLTVLDPGITAQPASQSTVAGQSATFSVSALGTAPIRYQWWKVGLSGGPVSGATNATLVVSNLLGNNAGGYVVLVSNVWGSAASDVAVLSVQDPWIATPPVNQDALPGDAVTFSVAAIGTAPLAYQWQFNGSNILGAVSAALTLPNISLADGGSYRVLVSNSFSTVISVPANLTVTLPAGSWGLRRGFTNESTLLAVTFGNGLFVAAGDSGSLLTSADGVAWTNHSRAPSDFLAGTAAGNGKFVAVGGRGSDAIILGSTDGVSWVDRNVTPSNAFSAAAFGNNRFVVVDGNGAILSSPDGISWTSIAAGQSSFTTVTYAHGKFIALASDGTVAESDDGIAWVQQNSGPTNVINSGIAFGNGLFVATGYRSVPGAPDYSLISRSADGLDWSAPASQFSYDHLYGVAYANGTFVAVGEDDGHEVLLTSNDGTNWVAGSSGANRPLYGVAFGNGRFVVVGQAAARISADGITWGPDNLHGIASGKGMLAAVGAQRTILTSSDGATWIDRTVGNTNGFDEIIFANNKFLAVGNGGAILTSADGVSWTIGSSGTPNELHGVIYAAGLYVAVGRQGTVVTSPDGISWTAHGSGTSGYLKAVAYGNGTFVAVGNLSSNVLTSANGVNWTIQSVPNLPVDAENIVYASGMFLSVGSCWVATSVNGVAWTVRSVGCYGLRSVAEGNGLFVIVADNGIILTSWDGVTWAVRQTGTGDNLRDVTYFNGEFVAVGNNGTILQSASFAPARLIVHGRPSDDGFEFDIIGEIGRYYRVQISTDLTNWNDSFSFTNSQRTTRFLDSSAPEFSRTFYRVLSP